MFNMSIGLFLLLCLFIALDYVDAKYLIHYSKELEDLDSKD